MSINLRVTSSNLAQGAKILLLFPLVTKINFLPFFIQKIIVSCDGEVCGEVRSFPIADAGAETPLP